MGERSRPLTSICAVLDESHDELVPADSAGNIGCRRVGWFMPGLRPTRRCSRRFKRGPMPPPPACSNLVDRPAIRDRSSNLWKPAFAPVRPKRPSISSAIWPASAATSSGLDGIGSLSSPVARAAQPIPGGQRDPATVRAKLLLLEVLTGDRRLEADLAAFRRDYPTATRANRWPLRAIGRHPGRLGGESTEPRRGRSPCGLGPDDLWLQSVTKRDCKDRPLVSDSRSATDSHPVPQCAQRSGDAANPEAAGRLERLGVFPGDPSRLCSRGRCSARQRVRRDWTTRCSIRSQDARGFLAGARSQAADDLRCSVHTDDSRRHYLCSPRPAAHSRRAEPDR